MAIRWSALALAAGLIALAGGTNVRGAHFGVTNYSMESAPACCAQTHFLTACAAPNLEPAGYTDEAAAKSETGPATPAGALLKPHVEVSRTPCDDGARTVTEVSYKKVTETVMKECRSTVYDTVCETHYKEFTISRHKRVCETISQPQRFLISKPVCETIIEEKQKTVCKPVCETEYRDCVEKVCTPVTETIMKESCRKEFREVTETECREVRKTVDETITCTKTVKRVVPVTECEKVCLPSRLCWKQVPRYECVLDPCTCTTVPKQVGVCRKLVREPACEIAREVTHKKIVVEQVPETKVIKKVVVEKVPTTVVKKVPITVHDKVPVTVTRNVVSTRVVKTPVTVTKMVATVEVVRVPVVVHRRIMGAYVDAAALTPEATGLLGTGREFACGGRAALGDSRATIYECAGPGRVFVEGLMGTRTVTHTVTKVVPVTEVCRIPYPIVKVVPRVVVKKVPVTVTRMVPIVVTKVVPPPACQAPCRSMTELVKRTGPCGCAPAPYASAPGDCAPAIIYEDARGRCGPTVGNCGKCGPSRYPYGCLDDPCRPHPIHDFLRRLFSGRTTCCKTPGCANVPSPPTVAPFPASLPAVTPPIPPVSTSDTSTPPVPPVSSDTLTPPVPPVSSDRSTNSPGPLPSIPPITLPPVTPR